MNKYLISLHLGFLEFLSAIFCTCPQSVFARTSQLLNPTVPFSPNLTTPLQCPTLDQYLFLQVPSFPDFLSSPCLCLPSVLWVVASCSLTGALSVSQEADQLYSRWLQLNVSCVGKESLLLDLLENRLPSLQQLCDDILNSVFKKIAFLGWVRLEMERKLPCWKTQQFCRIFYPPSQPIELSASSLSHYF